MKINPFKRNLPEENVSKESIVDLTMPSRSNFSINDRQTLTDPLLKDPWEAFSGWSNIMPNPDPVLKKLGKDIEVYDEMLSDPQLYGAIENNRKPGIMSLLYSVEGVDTPETEIKFYQEYFQDLVRNGKYFNIINKSLDTPYYGYIVFGTEWDVVGGKFVPVRIEAMPHSLVKFDKYGELLVSNDGYVFTKPEHPARYIVLQHKPTIVNPYGEPLLSRCFWNIMFKKDARKWWAIFAEKFGMPWALGEYDPKLLASQFSTTPQLAADKFLDQITNMVKDGVLAYPKGTTLNLIQGAAKGSADIYEKLVRICDEQNTKLILGHSGATESTSGDKLSNDTTATDVRDAVINADKQYPTYLFNNIIKWIHAFNFKSKAPQFILYKEEDVDLSVAQRDAVLQPVMSASGFGYTDSYFMKTYGFLPEDLKPVTQSAPSSDTKSVPASNNLKLKNKFLNAVLSDTKNVSDEQAAIDGLDNHVESELASDNAAMMEKMLKPLLEYVDKSGSIEEMLENYTDLFDQMNSKQMLDFITNLTQIAHIHGNNCQHVGQQKRLSDAK